MLVLKDSMKICTDVVSFSSGTGARKTSSQTFVPNRQVFDPADESDLKQYGKRRCQIFKA